MADFATYADVVARWRSLTADEQARVTTHLGDASALLRTLVPDIDARIAADNAASIVDGTAVDGRGNLSRVTTAKVVGVVKRYMENPLGAKQMQETLGPRSYGITLPDGQSTGVFFTEDDLAAVQPTAATKGSHAVGTAFATFRPGWGPPADPGSLIHWWPSS